MDLEAFRHSHTFGQELKRPGEKKSLIVSVHSGNGKTPAEYKQMLPGDINVVHSSIEVNPLP